MNNEYSLYDDIDQFLHTKHSHNQLQSQTPLATDQLLAQNARLLQQLQDQQRMLNFQSLFTHSMFQNNYIQQPTHTVPEITHKKIKKTKSELNRITSTASLKDPAVPIQDIKGNVKNAYIKKITSLLSVEGENLLNDEDLKQDLQDESISEELPQGPQFRLAGLLGSNNDLFSLEAKSKRLRKSAKQSRLRKKVYLKLLEKKVSELDGKIQHYKNGTKTSFDYLNTLLQSHPILNSMIIGNSQAMDQVLNCQQPEQAQLVLDSYVMRYGMTGIKRRDFLKYAVKNIQRNLLKGNYGLLLVSMKQDCYNYDQEFNNYVEIVKKLSKLDDDNLTYRILPTIDKLLNHRTSTQQTLLKFNETMKRLKNISNEIEETVGQFTQSLTPMQHIELIKQVDKLNNYSRGLQN